MEAATLAQRADGVGEGMVHLIFFFGEFGLLQPGTVRVRLFCLAFNSETGHAF